MIQILLVDDHPLVGEGTKLIIENEKEMKVQFETSSLQALDLIKAQSFDVLLFDLQMPEMDGFELAQKALEIRPNANIVIYSDGEIIPHLEQFMKSGAVGFVPKSSTKEHLIRAIRNALNKEIVLPVSMLKEIYKGIRSSSQLESSKELMSFSEKEKKIIKELFKGKTNKDIAQALFIGQRSLEYSLTNIFHKLGVRTRIEAVVRVKELGLIE